jgi:KamA family protein
MKFKAYTLQNFRNIPQINKLSEEEQFAIEVVGTVLPFMVNNYIIDELINWDNLPEDPAFILSFPQKDMLKVKHYEQMAELIKKQADIREIKKTANKIRMSLNPNPDGQMEHNVPTLGNKKLKGIQHKYNETALFFPSKGQTCHAYCTFCFRWPQFIGISKFKFAEQEADNLIKYLRLHPEVTDVLITGGDPLVMKAKYLRDIIQKILAANLNHIKNIRIGTKALSHWPYRFTSDEDAEELLDVFAMVNKSGKRLALMVHLSHPRELATKEVKKAIRYIQQTGTILRSQSPVMKHINDTPKAWNKMWRKQVQLGIIPYYMFVARDTGAQEYFGVPLVKSWHIFKEAYKNVSGLARTVRGPSMSADPGKVEVSGISEIEGKKFIALQFIQARNPDWIKKPFFAEYDETALWLDDLKPAFSDKFFFEDEFEKMVSQS